MHGHQADNQMENEAIYCITDNRRRIGGGKSKHFTRLQPDYGRGGCGAHGGDGARGGFGSGVARRGEVLRMDSPV
ncbi:hypothetical protein SESBI_27698 [Sesbania bispinosa]|nr:hypothetical protein SESBI_27698 [Sesbania bispinosa]